MKTLKQLKKKHLWVLLPVATAYTCIGIGSLLSGTGAGMFGFAIFVTLIVVLVGSILIAINETGGFD